MTKEEIIEMVMQIGKCDRPEDDSPALKMFVSFAKMVAEKENEECAKVIDAEAKETGLCAYYANLIRARGQE